MWRVPRRRPQLIGLCLPPPRRFFFKWPLKRWEERTEILQSWPDIFRTTFGKTKIGQARSLCYDVIRPTLHRNRVFSNLTCSHWMEWRYEWFMSESDRIWTKTLMRCLLILRKSSEANDVGWPTSVGILAIFLAIFWSPEDFTLIQVKLGVTILFHELQLVSSSLWHETPA